MSLAPVRDAEGYDGAPEGEGGDVDPRTVCPECGVTFKSFSGVQLHRRWKHPTEYHGECATVADSRQRVYWIQEEVDLLAKWEANYTLLHEGTKGLLSFLVAQSGRTIDGVKGQRRKPLYKAAVIGLIDRARLGALADTADRIYPVVAEDANIVCRQEARPREVILSADEPDAAALPVATDTDETADEASPGAVEPVSGLISPALADAVFPLEPILLGGGYDGPRMANGATVDASPHVEDISAKGGASVPRRRGPPRRARLEVAGEVHDWSNRTGRGEEPRSCRLGEAPIVNDRLLNDQSDLVPGGDAVAPRRDRLEFAANVDDRPAGRPDVVPIEHDDGTEALHSVNRLKMFLCSLDASPPGEDRGWSEHLLDSAILILRSSNDIGASLESFRLLINEHGGKVWEASLRRGLDKRGAGGRTDMPGTVAPDVVQPPVLHGRKLRKKQYTEMQRLFVKNRKRAAAKVLSGEWCAPEQGVTGNLLGPYWKTLFERPSPPDNRSYVPSCTKWLLENPISLEELKVQLKAITKSAPGPDLLESGLVKRIHPQILLKMMNAWLLCGEVPVAFREGRTILIPKGPNPQDAREYRPITVSSHLLRLFNKILAARISSECPVARAQKAFQPIDGCAENLAILDAVVSRARTRQSEVYLAFLDVAKAFDSVSHDSVARAMWRAGVPPLVHAAVMSGYKGAFTTLSANGKTLEQAKVTRGVKQGDPVSPVLFNMVLDEAVKKAEEIGVGVDVGGHRVSCLAFADDLVLAASSRKGLQLLVDSISGTLSVCGLTMNPAKCRSFSLCIDRKRKRWFVDDRVGVDLDDGAIPPLSAGDAYKYLGILVGPSGKARSYGSVLEDGLTQITKAPLKPQQRLFILINHLIPRIQHRLVLGLVYRTQLLRLTVRIRVAVRSWLKLPHDTTKAYLHARVADGGLGVPDLSIMTHFMKQRRLERLLGCSDPVTRAAASTAESIRAQRFWTGPSRVGNVVVGSVDAAHAAYHRALLDSVDGAGLCAAGEYPEAHRWVSIGTKLMSGRDFIQAVAVRGATLATPVRSSRGRLQVPLEDNKMCRGCQVTGSLGHILQVCPRVHGLRVIRHDSVASYLAGRVKLKGYDTMIEPRIPFRDSFRKPDLLAWRAGEDHVWIIDTQVVADGFSLTAPNQIKIQKYSDPEVLRGAMTLSGCSRATAIGATLNWRGCWSGESVRSLKGLGVTSGDLMVMAVRALTWAHRIFKAYNRTTG